MKLISPGVYTMTGLMVGRVYLIEDPDGLTLIDASIPPAASGIIAQIESLGRSVKDVKRILITHVHPDHIGALPRLKEVTGAELIAPAGERAVLEGREGIARARRENLGALARMMLPPDTMLPPLTVDRGISGGDTLPEILGGLAVISTPGHSPDHLSYWQPERRILFCGDVLMNLFGLRLPVAAFTVDMERNRRSISQVAALEPEIVCFGHGAPLVSRAAEQVRAFAAREGRA
jgi:glyoxylase-like metal-dependent hydrolase (beta-lactamase superfamily II)